MIRSNTDIIFMSKQNNTGIEAMYGIINTKLDKNEFAKFIGENAVNN